MSLVLQSSGGGQITIQEPTTASNFTQDLPAVTGNVVIDSATQTLTNKSIAATQLTGTIAAARLPTGSVLQVVEGTTASETFTTSASYQSTNLSASITPTSATSKILIIVSSTLYTSSSTYPVSATIFRGATNIASANSEGVLFWGEGASAWVKCASTFLDSPSSTSSLTYALHIKSGNAGTNVGANRNNTRNSIVLMEIAA